MIKSKRITLSVISTALLTLAVVLIVLDINRYNLLSAIATFFAGMGYAFIYAYWLLEATNKRAAESLDRLRETFMSEDENTDERGT